RGSLLKERNNCAWAGPAIPDASTKTPVRSQTGLANGRRTALLSARTRGSGRRISHRSASSRYHLGGTVTLEVCRGTRTIVQNPYPIPAAVSLLHPAGDVDQPAQRPAACGAATDPAQRLGSGVRARSRGARALLARAGAHRPGSRHPARGTAADA